VLGVRIELLVGHLFEMPLPQPEKRLLAIVEMFSRVLLFEAIQLHVPI